jgi:hypothetical protein
MHLVGPAIGNQAQFSLPARGPYLRVTLAGKHLAIALALDANLDAPTGRNLLDGCHDGEIRGERMGN